MHTLANIRKGVKALCLVAALATIAVPVGAQERLGQQTITGTMIQIGGRRGGQTSPFTLYVQRYSTTAEVERLKAALENGGQERLLEALDDTDVGRLTVPGSTGVPVNAVIASPTETGVKLQVLWARTIRFSELRYGTRSERYRVGYAELFLDRTGKGEGMAIPAARVRVMDDGTWEVENFGIYPVRLVNLQVSNR